MELIFSEITKYGGWVGMASVTVLYFLFPARKKELDSATATLVKTLQETVTALQQDHEIYKEKLSKAESKITGLEEQQKKSKEEIQKIAEERDGFREMIEARDKNTADFQKKAILAFEIMGATYEVVRVQNDNFKTIAEGLSKNNDMTKRFVELMDKHFINVEKAAIHA